MKYVIIFLLALLCAVVVDAQTRIWKGKNGQAIEAEYVRDNGKNVWIRPVGKREKQVPINKLCGADQNFILLQTLPKLEVDVDDDVSRGGVGGDMDNVRELVTFSVEVKKTSKREFPLEFVAHFFVIAEDVKYKEYILVEKRTEKFELSQGTGNSFSFTGERHDFEYDPDPGWGRKYDGYYVCVKTSDGRVVAEKGRDRYARQLNALLNGKVNRTRFDEGFNKI